MRMHALASQCQILNKVTLCLKQIMDVKAYLHQKMDFEFRVWPFGSKHIVSSPYLNFR